MIVTGIITIIIIIIPWRFGIQNVGNQLSEAKLR